jgi:hypothetical protein
METVIMNTTVTQSPAPAPATSNQPDKIDAQFDAAIGLPPQSQDADYLKAYFNSGHVPF